MINISAALGALAQCKMPLEAKAEKTPRPAKPAKAKIPHDVAPLEKRAPRREKPQRDVSPPKGMERYRIEVGHSHGVKPANIVGAIANEAELDAEHIGRIDIQDDHSLVDLPEGMPKEIFKHLKTVWVSGERLQISRTGGDAPPRRKPGGAAKRKPS